MQYYIIQFNICIKQYIVYEYESLDLYTVSSCMFAFG